MLIHHLPGLQTSSGGSGGTRRLAVGVVVSRQAPRGRAAPGMPMWAVVGMCQARHTPRRTFCCEFDRLE